MLNNPQTDKSLDPGVVAGIPAEISEVRNAEEVRVLSPTMAFESVFHKLRRTGQQRRRRHLDDVLVRPTQLQAPPTSSSMMQQQQHNGFSFLVRENFHIYRIIHPLIQR